MENADERVVIQHNEARELRLLMWDYVRGIVRTTETAGARPTAYCYMLQQGLTVLRQLRVSNNLLGAQSGLQVAELIVGAR